MTRFHQRRLFWITGLLAAVGLAVQPVWAAKGGSMFSQFVLTGNLGGNLINFFLLGLSMAGVALIIMHLLKSRAAEMLPEELALTMEQLITERKFREAIEYARNDRSVFGQMMHEALTQATYGYAAMEQAVIDAGGLASAARIRAAEPLNVLGAVGPMIGLFGTVLGMILTFSEFGGGEGEAQPKPAELAVGVRAALTSTFWGLVVAVPAVVAYGVVRTRIEGMTDAAVSRAHKLLAQFRPLPTRRPIAGAAAAATPTVRPAGVAAAEPAGA